MQKFTLDDLRQQIKTTIPNDCFDLDTGEQSFNIYPSEHINLTDNFYSVNLGYIVYGNITVYCEVLENLQRIVRACQTLSDEISDYIQVIYSEASETPFRTIIGGSLTAEFKQEAEDFETLDQMLNYMNNFEFIRNF